MWGYARRMLMLSPGLLPANTPIRERAAVSPAPASARIAFPGITTASGEDYVELGFS